MKPALVVLAAGLGSRYGGLKQIIPVGPGGEILMEYAVYDAIRAGFGRVVFVIREEMLNDFKVLAGDKISRYIPVDYVFQTMETFGQIIAPDRIKPWGTGHAVLSCINAVKEPFCIVHADDFYGQSSFHAVAKHLNNTDPQMSTDSCLVGFRAVDTMSEYGPVSRACCETDDDGYLLSLTERVRLQMINGQLTDLKANEKLPSDTLVSCGMMGFPAEVLQYFYGLFKSFLEVNQSDLLTAEFFLPSAVSQLITGKTISMKVLPTNSRWYGFTYREDHDMLVNVLNGFVQAGEYPKKLF
jgi:NDP-sugar pyrophosphorylase family protein